MLYYSIYIDLLSPIRIAGFHDNQDMLESHYYESRWLNGHFHYCQPTNSAGALSENQDTLS